MPPTSTIKQFVDALQTRQTKCTKAFDQLFRSPARVKNHPSFDKFARAGALRAPLPAWARNELIAAGLGPREIAAINKWPNAQKEQVRRTLVAAVNRGRRVRFYWELHNGRGEETDAPARIPRTGSVAITFRSPQRKVRVSSSAATFGHVSVAVG